MKGCTIHISTLANDLGNPGASFILHVSNSVGGIPGGITVTKLQLSLNTVFICPFSNAMFTVILPSLI